MTTSENSVGVRVPANVAGRASEDTPHGGVVTSNRPAERTDEVIPADVVGAEPNAVTHNDAGSVLRRGPGSPLSGGSREHRVDDGLRMA